jgi:hypothetical protein
MNDNQKQWQRVFAEFHTQLEGKLQELPMETWHSIRYLAKSVADHNKPNKPEGNPK